MSHIREMICPYQTTEIDDIGRQALTVEAWHWINDQLPDLCDLLGWDCYNARPMPAGSCRRTNTIRSWGLHRHDYCGGMLMSDVLARVAHIQRKGGHVRLSIHSGEVTVAIEGAPTQSEEFQVGDSPGQTVAVIACVMKALDQA